MLYLSGAVRAEVAVEPYFGFLVTPAIGNRLPFGATWAADTGCFRHPEAFDGDKYLRWLEKKLYQTGRAPLFVNAPDRLGDAAATIRVALPFLKVLRREGYRTGFVSQNGLTPANAPWGAFDVQFLGGDIEWKLGDAAFALVAEARCRQIESHMGRVNTPERMLTAARFGCASVDGTKLAHGFDANWPELREWVRCLNHQRWLDLGQFAY